MPSLSDFGFKDLVPDPRSCYPFIGGEDHGLKRLKEYMKKSVGFYAQTRNQLMGSEYSSKLSPWLANGSLSARRVFHETKKCGTSNNSTKTFIDELFWRDFNRFWCMRHGNKVFSSYGIYNRTYYDWNTDHTIL